mgnify:CR=1 FL=1
MKIRGSTPRSISSQKAGKKGKVNEASGDLQVEAVESVDAVDEVDRFEVGESKKARPDEDGEEEMDAMMSAIMENPTVFRSAYLPALLGMDAISPNVEATLQGLMSLVDPKGE